ncbi:MAG TPA: hypothetical protein EYN66_07320 [Myxococcales bacterium]|nr:hypothetical protein [Myxococcales bacterium]
MRRVAFVIKTLVEEAGDVPVFLVLLPRLSDIAAYKTQGPSKLAEAFGTVVPVIDLLPSFAKAPDPSVLFNECDRRGGHWLTRWVLWP